MLLHRVVLARIRSLPLLCSSQNALAYAAWLNGKLWESSMQVEIPSVVICFERQIPGEALPGVILLPFVIIFFLPAPCQNTGELETTASSSTSSLSCVLLSCETHQFLH